MELATFAAGVNGGRQVAEEVGGEDAAGKAGVEVAGVNAGEVRTEPGGNHLVREFAGRDARGGAPDREDRFEAGAGELPDAVVADVFEEEIAEGDAVDSGGGGAGEDLGHLRLVLDVGAGKGEVDLPERKAGGGGLEVEKLFAKAVDGDPGEMPIDAGEQADDAELWLLTQLVEGPGAILAAAPTEQDVFLNHG